MSKSFVWFNDRTPVWFDNLASSYRYNLDTNQIQLPTREGNVTVDPGDTVELDGEVFKVTKPGKPNREQRRASTKADERLVVSTILVTFENGQTANLDPNKVMIIDKDSKANLFQYVMEKKQ